MKIPVFYYEFVIQMGGNTVQVMLLMLVLNITITLLHVIAALLLLCYMLLLPVFYIRDVRLSLALRLHPFALLLDLTFHAGG